MVSCAQGSSFSLNSDQETSNGLVGGADQVPSTKVRLHRHLKESALPSVNRPMDFVNGINWEREQWNQCTSGWTSTFYRWVTSKYL